MFNGSILASILKSSGRCFLILNSPLQHYSLYCQWYMSAFSPSFLSPELILDEAGSGRNGLNIFGPLELSFRRLQGYVTEPYLMNTHFWSFLGRAGSSWSMSNFFLNTLHYLKTTLQSMKAYASAVWLKNLDKQTTLEILAQLNFRISGHY